MPWLAAAGTNEASLLLRGSSCRGMCSLLIRKPGPKCLQKMPSKGPPPADLCVWKREMMWCEALPEGLESCTYRHFAEQTLVLSSQI